MACILQFAPARDAKPKRQIQSDDALGEVVIFPGVRIERHEDPVELPDVPPVKQARKS